MPVKKDTLMYQGLFIYSLPEECGVRRKENMTLSQGDGEYEEGKSGRE